MTVWWLGRIATVMNEAPKTPKKEPKKARSGREIAEGICRVAKASKGKPLPKVW